MENIIGLKELRQNMDHFAQMTKKGQSFLVIKRSRPLFKITPINQTSDGVESVVDFLQTGANDVNKTLKPLSKKEHDYYINL